MKPLLSLAVALALAASAVALDTGNRAPDKPAANHPPNVPSDLARQGGDTVADATLITLPHSGTGTTAGYNDDYDEACPYTQSTSPDVVYTFTPPADVHVDIDMLGSAYDTKIYVYDEYLNLIACNDDFYPDYVSKLENVALMGFVQYFLIIDGYGGDFGDYVLTISEFEPCVIDCPAGAVHEDEPPLVDDYVDLHNGGCNTDPDNPPFQWITWDLFCGESGWYLYQGGNYRDTDWFKLTIPWDGFLEIIGDAEQETYMFELGPQDCGNVAVIQDVVMGPCTEATIVIPGPVGSEVWFWVGPTTFEGPVDEYNYFLWINMITDPVETRSWTDVKGLFD